MRIAFFYELDYGGARRAVLEFGKELKNNNLVDLYYIDNKIEEGLEEYFSSIYLFKFFPKKWSGNNWKVKLYKDTIELWKLYNLHKYVAKTIDTRKYNAVFVHGSKYTQAPFILRFLKSPSFYYSQESLRIVYEDIHKLPEPLDFYRKTYEKINRFIRKKIDRSNILCAKIILTNSEFTKRNLKSNYGLDSQVLYLGVDTKKFYPEKISKKIDILFIGDEEETDGYYLLRDSIKFMKVKPNVKYLLRKKEWVSDDQLRKIYSGSKILTCLTQGEPFGLLPLEAQACGTMVVALAEGGYLESVVNRKTGIFVKREPHNLAKTIDYLLENETIIKRYSKNAINEIKKKWTWEKRTADLKEILLEVLKNEK